MSGPKVKDFSGLPIAQRIKFFRDMQRERVELSEVAIQATRFVRGKVEVAALKAALVKAGYLSKAEA